MARTVEVVNGKARYEGRTLEEWVPEIVTELVAAVDPLEIVFYPASTRPVEVSVEVTAGQHDPTRARD